MTDDEWKVALEIIHDIDRSLDRLKDDFADIGRSMDRMETSLTGMEQTLAAMNGRGPTRTDSVFDRIEAHLDRIEELLGFAPLPG